MGRKQASFKSSIQKLHGKGGFHFFNVPTAAGRKFSKRKKGVRVFCTINETVRYACALRPNGEGGFFINTSVVILRKGKLKLGQKIEVVLEEDTTEYGHKVPEELTEILATDEEGARYFSQLTNGAQRSLIYYIAQAKSIDKRIERSLLFINRLKNTKGAWKPGKN